MFCVCVVSCARVVVFAAFEGSTFFNGLRTAKANSRTAKRLIEASNEWSDLWRPPVSAQPDADVNGRTARLYCHGSHRSKFTEVSPRHQDDGFSPLRRSCWASQPVHNRVLQGRCRRGFRTCRPRFLARRARPAVRARAHDDARAAVRGADRAGGRRRRRRRQLLSDTALRLDRVPARRTGDGYCRRRKSPAACSATWRR
jgi:hypothetical protein